MTARLLTMAFTLAIAALAAGCAPDCVAACEKGNNCQGAVKQDCAKVCADAETVNELANCEDQYSDLLTCIEDQEDYCVSAAQCETKREQYQDCYDGYCINHAQDCPAP